MYALALVGGRRPPTRFDPLAHPPPTTTPKQVFQRSCLAAMPCQVRRKGSHRPEVWCARGREGGKGWEGEERERGGMRPLHASLGGSCMPSRELHGRVIRADPGEDRQQTPEGRRQKEEGRRQTRLKGATAGLCGGAVLLQYSTVLLSDEEDEGRASGEGGVLRNRASSSPRLPVARSPDWTIVRAWTSVDEIGPWGTPP